MRGSAIHHAIGGKPEMAACIMSWVGAAPYIMPSVYEACKVNNNVKYFVHRTSRRG
jgi:hypothetical protein